MKAVAANPGQVSNDARKVAAFVECFRTHPQGALIANLHTRMEHFRLGDLNFPISINSASTEGTCYICDPVTGYVDYAKDELRNFAAHPALRWSLGGLLRASSPLVRATGLRNIVFVNNWLFSTNPAPDISRRTALDITQTLTARFPDKVIAMRSLNTVADAGSIAALRAQGFRMLPSRQIYIYPAKAARAGASRNMINDLKLLHRTDLQHVANAQFHADDFARSAQLYSMLYLDKYTQLNPQYTALYVQQMHARGLIELEGLRDRSGALVAVTGLFENGNTLTQPIVGYDTSRPLQEGLYRMVMMIAQQSAISRGRFFNASAGAAQFKRLRRAVPAIEYTAIFDRHLPKGQQCAIRALEMLLGRIGVPLLQRFEL